LKAAHQERRTMSDQHPSATSRSVWIDRFGDLDVLQIADRPITQPVDDEVLVRVRAASINPVDWKIAAGEFPAKGADQLPFGLGRDLAGTIEAVGTRAHNMLSHGDRVMAHVDFDRGAQSEYVVVKAVELVAMPAGIDFPAAAGAGLVSMTAWQGLFDHGGLQPGQRVLIHGGAGGVGHMAVQFAHWEGATVYATAGGHDLDFVRSLGADEVIDYESQKFEDVARDMDLVFDTRGGETQARSFATLKKGGRLVSTLQPDEAAAAAHGVRVAPRWMAQPNAAQLGEVVDLMAAGTVRVEVARTFALADAQAAYRFARDEHPRGKVVLTLD
jgi:NADPH:quinone reductase-like Zn-dependent oxidoreductase